MSHKVAIVMGSGSDRPTMEKAGVMLDQFGIAHEFRVISDVFTPDKDM
jgi:phosphoribosylcarboxyaminoimidazole (NCAIR) mutase